MNFKLKTYHVIFFSICFLLFLAAKQSRLDIYKENINKCTAKTRIAFLKTHKCASSTIQNILFRYGDNNNLNFVLPLKGNYLGRNESFNIKLIKSTPWHNKLEYNIFALHTIWNTSEIKNIYKDSKDDVIFISILRDPVDMFQSLYYYAEWDKLFRMDIDQFASVINFETNRSNDFQYIAGYTGHNQMLHDFGVEEYLSNDVNEIKEKINEIEKDFHLILIAEYMDESLILLKNLLCWDLSDITYFPLNQRIERSKIKKESRKELEKWLSGDVILYKHFKQIFFNKLQIYGVDQIKNEINNLRDQNENIKNTCNLSEVIKYDSEVMRNIFKPYNDRVKTYKVINKKYCENYVENELSYIEFLKWKQLKKIKTKV